MCCLLANVLHACDCPGGQLECQMLTHPSLRLNGVLPLRRADHIRQQTRPHPQGVVHLQPHLVCCCNILLVPVLVASSVSSGRQAHDQAATREGVSAAVTRYSADAG
jgi:hypothetical protein